MSHKLSFLSKLTEYHTHDIGFVGSNVKISDELQGHLSEKPDAHTLDIGTIFLHELLADGQ
jgi:hypothetical protein